MSNDALARAVDRVEARSILETLDLDELEAIAKLALDALRERTRAAGDEDARRHHADGLKCVECLASWARVRSAANDNGR